MSEKKSREEWMHPISPSVSIDLRIMNQFKLLMDETMNQIQQNQDIADMHNLMLNAFLRGATIIHELMPDNVWPAIKKGMDVPEEFKIAEDIWKNFKQTILQARIAVDNPSGNVELN